jgi:hypothetical protein
VPGRVTDRGETSKWARCWQVGTVGGRLQLPVPLGAGLFFNNMEEVDLGCCL